MGFTFLVSNKLASSKYLFSSKNSNAFTFTLEHAKSKIDNNIIL